MFRGLSSVCVILSLLVIVHFVGRFDAQAQTASGDEEKRSRLSEILSSWWSSDPGDAQESTEGTDGGWEPGGEFDSFSASEVLTPEELNHALPWRAPDYSQQTGALGWSETAFRIPIGMESRVAFWRDIYSKYTTEQGVLHDSVNVEIVYTPVDFSHIMKDDSTNLYQKARLREKYIDEKRKEIIERLKRLHGRSSPAGLTGDDLRVWKLFERVQDPNKFLTAAEKGRVRFQLGQKDKFVLGVYYSGRYLKEMEKIFREEGLPIELTRLPFVESSFNINARSRVGASGIWQFMPRTAKPYMRVSKEIDERNDPIRATRASARVFKQNYMMLESWPLAVTGYNHGAYGVRGITNKLGTRDLAEIIRRYSSRTFGFASENFYACFLAALEVERNARKLLGDVKWSPEFPGSEIKVTRPVAYSSLLTFFDGDEKSAALLNPHLNTKVRNGKSLISQGTFIRVPASRSLLAQDFMRGKVSPSKLASAVQSAPIPVTTSVTATTVALVSADGSDEGKEGSTVREKIEKLSAAAAAILPVLSSQDLPTPTPTPATITQVQEVLESQTPLPAEVVPAIEKVSLRRHKVRSGENLIRIAQKYGVDLDLLKKQNGLEGSGRRRGMIKAGQVLTIPDTSSESDR